MHEYSGPSELFRHGVEFVARTFQDLGNALLGRMCQHVYVQHGADLAVEYDLHAANDRR